MFDDELRALLRRIGEDHRPAAAAEEEVLDAILARGRRRLRYQRMGAAAAVIALIGGLGTGVAALQPEGSGTAERVPAASGLQRGESRPGGLPGWEPVDDSVSCTRPGELPPPYSGIETTEPGLHGPALAPKVISSAEFRTLVRHTLPDTHLELLELEYEKYPPRGSVLTEVVLDTAPVGTTALIGMRASRAYDDAAAEADRHLVCDSWRLRLAPDIVLQLPPRSAPADRPAYQQLEIYRTGYPTYLIWTSSWIDSEDEHGSVPPALTTEQLTELGRRLATAR
ncbi:hypothetical protein [Amycolatopsis cihanbeyliensis]|uniref:Uncharacterized protein n=1 Tax=Amycolatopsis cihanbeyliensis TaxID=1128664 RepID=A0A542DIF6_AMYCI|nr:hypothetical protein [Amycolatopsis cihanbeyliensis]TQJ02879.1 hypothetical protein FB471_2629 [Amycolatopsis cihanbeyliensis]